MNNSHLRPHKRNYKKYSTLIFSATIALASLFSALVSENAFAGINTNCRPPQTQLNSGYSSNTVAMIYDAIGGRPSGSPQSASSLGMTGYTNYGIRAVLYGNGQISHFERCNPEYRSISGGESFYDGGSIKADCLNPVDPVFGGGGGGGGGGWWDDGGWDDGGWDDGGWDDDWWDDGGWDDDWWDGGYTPDPDPWWPPTPDPPPPPDPPVSCDDCGYVTGSRPIISSLKYDAPKPSAASASGYATATAITPKGTITSGKITAKPGDNVTIDARAKVAYISGKTYSISGEALSNLDPSSGISYVSASNNEISATHNRTLTTSDAGKVFYGSAKAAPTSSALTVGNPIYSSQIVDYTTSTSSDICSTWYTTGSIRCTWTSYNPTYSQYISGWNTSYTQSGSTSARVEIEVPHNYNVCLEDVPNPSAECNPPAVPQLDACVALAPPRCDPRSLGVRYAGEDYEFANAVTVQPVNSGTNLGSYATNTRASTYEIVSFVIRPDGGQAKTGGNGTNRTTTAPGSGNSCSYYVTSGQLSRGCIVVQRQDNVYFNTKDGKVNSSGASSSSAYNINGDPSSAKSLGVNLTVDDLPVGSKFCVAISVWPASYTGLDKDFKGSTWKHGTPQCYTIAKKPTAQFQGAGIYSAGSITTSQSLKNPGFVANNYNKGLSSTTETRRIFGSWSEYQIIGGKPIKGMASGAAFGYNPGTSSSAATYNNGNYLAQVGGLITTRAAATNTTCFSSTQTFANAVNGQCNNSSVKLGNSQISPNLDLTLDRIISRFSNTPCSSSIGTINVGSTTECRTVSEDGRTHQFTSGATTVTLNGAIIPKGRTVTVTVPGTLIINGDIKYQDTSYADTDDLPQMIIFANDIQVEAGVSQIDAWLIVGQRDPIQNDRVGVLNTCRGFVVGSSDANTCNKQLKINGPVYASRLVLNRTYGAETGNSSIVPAEVFNLRIDSYLWAYAQAQKHTQAVVTFTRELAPRY